MSQQSISDFKSVPWCFNGHAHTILSSLLFSSPAMEYKRIRISTPDDDFIDLDVAEQDKKDSPVVVIFHGLEGSSHRYYVRKLGKKLFDTGMHVVAVNLRSCSGEMNNQPRFYHSGETEDAGTILRWVTTYFPSSVQFAAGFSLGASIILNYLHKQPNNHTITAFSAVSTPFNLKCGSINLQKGFNRIYDYRFLRTLESKLKAKREMFPGLPMFNGSTLYDFDDQITGPLHGFDDAEDYYRKSSSAFFMNEINTPGLIIHSKQDPLCPFEYTPVDDIETNPNLMSAFAERGGHVGFWGHPNGWTESATAQYFAQFL